MSHGAGAHQPTDPPVDDMRVRLRAALPVALEARDTSAVAALRTAMAALENAEAIDASDGRSTAAESEHVAGGVVGLGVAEVPRRQLDAREVEAVVREEVAQRRAVAETYERSGRRHRAERLRAEADVLVAHLDAAAT